MTPDLTTPGKRYRFRRDLVIFVAAREGVSQRVLAEVFDLPRSRIATIIAAIAKLGEDDDVRQSDPVDRPVARLDRRRGGKPLIDG